MTIDTVGIIGAGTMGSALAQKFAQENLNVILMDRETQFTNRGMDLIRGTLKEGQDRGIFSEERVSAILGRITPTTEQRTLNQCDLIIEAIFEDFDVKKDLFESLSNQVPDTCILASNTSSFGISDLAQFVKKPKRFVGLHFFYHAAKNRLVEIIPGEQTDPALIDTMFAFMQRVGKDPITCKDANGFVVNRFFVPWLNEAVRLLEEGVADAGTIDSAACKAFGCGMGPFALMNATGVPIALHAEETLAEAFGEFYDPANALEAQVALGNDWLIEETKRAGEEAKQTIENRLIGSVMLVSAQLLSEKVCTAGDLDRGAAIGLRWRKTPIVLMQKLGWDKAFELMQQTGQPYDVKPPRRLSAEDWIPDYVSTSVRGSVGRITFNRPQGMNALNPQIMDQLGDAFHSLNNDPSVKTIVLTGSGKAFVAGADIKFFVDHIKRGTIPEIVEFTRKGQELFREIDESEKRIVALVNGLALGGGLELALTADKIIALKSAKFAFPETGIGIYPGLGGTSRTVKRVGNGLTHFLVGTGQMISAKDALEMGLVDAVIGWDQLETALQNPENFLDRNESASEKWAEIAKLFIASPTDLLEKQDLNEIQQKLVKKLRYKAPVALRVAHELIAADAEPEAELDHLEMIFKTEDALTGLSSLLTGERPVFKGA